MAAYGGEASEADTRAVTAVIRKYYAAAAAEDGQAACQLLYSSLATGLAEGVGGGGKTCPAAISVLFKQQHSHIVADDVPTMVVISVHAKGNLGLAVLGFRRVPESEILVEREGSSWKIDALFDSEMT
ncbi:MAG TPA: hypothetical protein VK781_13640 [Solirubrobacteraceae bacterium]|nr:hypothetical protein [Solirubrobacteraceae bacterium]